LQAEDGDGYIVRLADVHGRGGRGSLLWLDQSFPLEWSPFQVLTLRLTRREGRWQMHPCDMLERTEHSA
jgi:hypothetical protein